LIKVIDGDYQRENYIHHICSKFNFRGEWFYPDKELLRYINELTDDYNFASCNIVTVSWRIPVQVFKHANVVADEIGYGSWQDMMHDCFLDYYPLPKG